MACKNTAENPRPVKKERSHILAIGQSGSPRVARAIDATGGIDDDFHSSATFDTVMGDIELGKNGDWAHPPVLQVQFQGIVGQEGQAVQGRIKTGRRLTSVVSLGGVDISLCREQPGPTWHEE
jgi:hypothetical protein